jgi:2-oxoglutarate dehydrogenase E1 component
MRSRFRKPLIVMTPKSLLRHKLAVSRTDDLTSGHFEPVLDDPAAAADAKVLLLCSGKVYYDLMQRRDADSRASTAIVRLEQLYPLPEERLRQVLARYAGCERVRWVQEEPRNRGAWTYVREYLEPLAGARPIEYVGRPEGASPATGSHKVHEAELEALIRGAFAATSAGAAAAQRKKRGV